MADFALMIKNCFEYNSQSDGGVVANARNLNELFKQEVEKYDQDFGRPGQGA